MQVGKLLGRICVKISPVFFQDMRQQDLGIEGGGGGFFELDYRLAEGSLKIHAFMLW